MHACMCVCVYVCLCAISNARSVVVAVFNVCMCYFQSVVVERVKRSVEGDEELLCHDEAFEEVLNVTSRRRHHKIIDSDGNERTRVQMSTTDNGREVVFNDEWHSNSEGTKWGKKWGTTAE